MKHKLLLVSAVVIAACTPLNTEARAKKSDASASPSASATAAKTSGAPEGSPATQRAIPFHGMISAVDMRTMTFTIAGKEKSRAFKLTDKTVITKAGAAAKTSDVVANEEARGSYWKMNDGSLEVKTLKLGPLTQQEQAAKDARKAKRAEKKAAAGTSSSPAASPSAAAH